MAMAMARIASVSEGGVATEMQTSFQYGGGTDLTAYYQASLCLLHSSRNIRYTKFTKIIFKNIDSRVDVTDLASEILPRPWTVSQNHLAHHEALFTIYAFGEHPSTRR